MKLPNRRSLVLFIGLLLFGSVVCRPGAPITTPPANNFVTATSGGTSVDATDTPNAATPNAPTPLVPVRQTFTPAPPPINTVEPVQAKINGPTRGQVGEVLTFNSDGSSGPISVVSWDFGDGTSDTGKTSVSHTYQTPGVYTVKVTAQGASGASTASLTLSIDPAQEDLRAVINGPTTGQVGQSLNFNAFNSSGPIISVMWDFGDGTGAGNNSQVSHIYNAAGTYRVTLTVLSQNSTTTATLNVVINRPPERVRAVINGPTYGRVGEPLTFNSFGSSGPIATVSWRFGDGTGAGDQVAVTHSYVTPGLYEVVLLVHGESINSGNDSTSMMVRIDPAPEQVRAVISGPNYGRVGENLTFHAFNSTGPIATVSWNFGDGSVAGDQRSVTHSFFAPGTYQVTLRVQGENPGSGSDSASLVVSIQP
jgi:PKD repeat protein